MNFSQRLRTGLAENVGHLIDRLSPTAQLRAFGLMQIPLIFLVNPKVEKISDEECEVRIALNRMTRNHLGSMYFGTLAIGADASLALFALHIAKKYKDVKVVVVFKDFKADFLKRAESDVIFKCQSGEQIRQMIEKAHSTGARVTEAVAVEGHSSTSPAEVVARFTLGLSIRAHKK